MSIACYIIFPQVYSLDLVQNSFIMKITLLIEATLIFHNVFALIQCALLLSYTILAIYQVLHCELAIINKNFLKLLKKLQNGHRINTKELKQLKFILNQHITLSYYILRPDKTTWSQALYYYALISIPINVTIMCELIVEDLLPETKLLIIMIAIVHGITGSFPFLLAANMSSDFHSIKDYLPAMQLQLKRSTHLRLKLKYDDLYERLITGRKISYTFGTLGNLTFRGLFEAFLGYIIGKL
uniref:Uncharacterized protein LOC113795823 n=1 Tax=Dermatophagoides pteronyssinus TaxID=6956 RepID=A0A6P6Y903_DERPT|nr:uncharacterized protein LOC113795823 [Dermatophagoides pteronyssinus]